MESVLFLCSSSYVLLVLVVVALALWYADRRKRKCREDAEAEAETETGGPREWPVVGALPQLAGVGTPYQAFGALAQRFGPVFRLRLGSTRCVVVNGLDNIREVLVARGASFDGRPDFGRYRLLFSGDRQNSLAFCDWSELHKSRREMLRVHMFPRAFSKRFNELDDVVRVEMKSLLRNIDALTGGVVDAKPLILHSAANIFTSYFCSRSFEYGDEGFGRMVANFDEIFYEINQGYLADFIPWLMPFHKRHLDRVSDWSHSIRDFVTKRIVADRLDGWVPGTRQTDYVDCLVDHVKNEKQPSLSWDSALFALEDIVGGHSAIGNLLVKVLAYVVLRSDVQDRICEEAERAAAEEGQSVGLGSRTLLPYTEAVVLEALRLIASPIVPRVASQTSSVAGLTVDKGTLVFLNNYDLNMSPDLWVEPEKFNPERFLCNGCILKPDFFLPFGGGRRSCLGYKMVQLLSFSTLATLCQNYRILPSEGESYNVPVGGLALPRETFKFCFQRR